MQVNSKEYWDEKFSKDWIPNKGRQQSVFFANIALNSFPEWLTLSIKEEGLTLCDWGCALGDGTFEFHKKFPGNTITGIDFSSKAIEDAREKYPEVEFSTEDLLNNGSSKLYDIIFSSNTLEHFARPWDVLSQLSTYSRQHFIALVPYREYERYPEHLYSFDENNIPSSLADSFFLTGIRITNGGRIVPHYWGELQVLLIYSRESVAREKKIKSISDSEIRIMQGIYQQDDTMLLLKEIQDYTEMNLAAALLGVNTLLSKYDLQDQHLVEGLQNLNGLSSSNTLLTRQLIEKEATIAGLGNELAAARSALAEKEHIILHQENRLKGSEMKLIETSSRLTDAEVQAKKTEIRLTAEVQIEQEKNTVLERVLTQLFAEKDHAVTAVKEERDLLERKIGELLNEIQGKKVMEEKISVQDQTIVQLKKEIFRLGQHEKELLDSSGEFQTYIYKLQKDIDWYKETFEERSIWGVVKSKIMSRTPKK